MSVWKSSDIFVKYLAHTVYLQRECKAGVCYLRVCCVMMWAIGL